MNEMGLGSGVSRLMKEEMFPAAERGLDKRWSSDSSTSKAITAEPIGQNAQSSLCARCRLSGKSLVGIYLCSGSLFFLFIKGAIRVVFRVGVTPERKTLASPCFDLYRPVMSM